MSREIKLLERNPGMQIYLTPSSLLAGDDIAAGGNETTVRERVYPCNQFALHVYVTSTPGGGAEISQIHVNNFCAYTNNWHHGGANQDELGGFDLVNGSLPRGIPHTFTFGVYSNTTLDLLASSSSWYGDITITVTNTDAVEQTYSLYLMGWTLQDRKYSIQAYNVDVP